MPGLHDSFTRVGRHFYLSHDGGQTPESHLIEQRLQKLGAIRELGVEPYPYRFESTHSSAEIAAAFETLEENKTSVAVAGRLMDRFTNQRWYCSG